MSDSSNDEESQESETDNSSDSDHDDETNNAEIESKKHEKLGLLTSLFKFVILLRLFFSICVRYQI